MRPKVSVVVPIYNVEAYIERCVRSLFEQTLDSLEYIFVNDCTPDNSMLILNQVLEEYPQRKEQVRIIDQPQNRGAAKAREVGIKTATGEYIIHCDSDDWVDNDMYRVMYEKASADGLDMVICDWVETDGETDHEITQNLNCSDRGKMMRGLLNRSISGSLCNKLIACYIYKKCIEIYPQSHMMEDVLYSVQIFFNCRQIGYISIPYYYYFSNIESICKKDDERSCLNRCQQAIRNIDDIIRFITSKGQAKEYRNELVVLKNSAKVFLWPLLMTQPLKHYKKWRNVYPEINWRYPFTPGIDPVLRVIFFLTVLYIYPCIHKIIGAITWDNIRWRFRMLMFRSLYFL